MKNSKSTSKPKNSNSKLSKEVDKRLKFALGLIPKARKIVLKYYQKKIKIDLKENLSEVSRADKECELFLRHNIQAKFPHDGIIGEEFPQKNRSGEFTWTLDPIDGTFSFVRGNPFFGCMLGLIHQETAVMGLIDFPALKETIYGTKGHGSYYKDFHTKTFKKCFPTVRSSSLSEALFSHTGPELWSAHHLEDKLTSLRQITKQERTWGDCYGYYLLAKGHCDIMADPKLAIWDLIPIQLIVKEAGLCFYDLNGRDSIKIENSIAFFPQLLPEISKALHWRKNN